MLMKLITAIVVIGLSFWIDNLKAQSIPDKPEPAQFINDFAKILQPQEVEQLENKLKAYNDSTSTQIVIITVKNTGGFSIENYALKLATNWGIGQKGVDNGILILISLEDRKIRIEIGYGIEDKITDIIANQLIINYLQPNFRKKQYFNGLEQCSNKIFAILKDSFRPVIFWAFWTNERVGTYGLYFFIILTSIYYNFLQKKRLLQAYPIRLTPQTLRWWVGLYIFFGLGIEFLCYSFGWRFFKILEMDFQGISYWLIGGGLLIFDFGYLFLGFIFKNPQSIFQSTKYLLAGKIIFSILYLGIILPFRIVFVLFCGLLGWFLLSNIFSGIGLFGILISLIFAILLYALSFPMICVVYATGKDFSSSYSSNTATTNNNSSASGSTYSDSFSASFGGGDFGGGGASGSW